MVSSIKNSKRSSVMRSPATSDGFKLDVTKGSVVYRLYKLKKYPDSVREAQEILSKELKGAQLSIFLSFDVEAFKAAVILPNENRTKYGIYMPKKLYNKAFKRM